MFNLPPPPWSGRPAADPAVEQATDEFIKLLHKQACDGWERAEGERDAALAERDEARGERDDLLILLGRIAYLAESAAPAETPATGEPAGGQGAS